MGGLLDILGGKSVNPMSALMTPPPSSKDMSPFAAGTAPTTPATDPWNGGPATPAGTWNGMKYIFGGPGQ
jgi:hypothetical protein